MINEHCGCGHVFSDHLFNEVHSKGKCFPENYRINCFCSEYKPRGEEMADSGVSGVIDHMVKEYPYYLHCIAHVNNKMLLENMLKAIVEKRQQNSINPHIASQLIHDIKNRLDILKKELREHG